MARACLADGFCAACGVETGNGSGGWKRICPACGVQHFPRVDPVTIMLAIYKGGAEPVCLLGRQAAWPEGRMSALAGFLEPGETIEAACAREIEEEAGLTVTAVRYHSSQPWPFPASIMLGFHAEGLSEDITIDAEELQDARWFSRADLRNHEALGFGLPRADSIARRLIEDWLNA